MLIIHPASPRVRVIMTFENEIIEIFDDLVTDNEMIHKVPRTAAEHGRFTT